MLGVFSWGARIRCAGGFTTLADGDEWNPAELSGRASTHRGTSARCSEETMRILQALLDRPINKYYGLEATPARAAQRLRQGLVWARCLRWPAALFALFAMFLRTTSEQTAYGNDQDECDDANPEHFESLYYGARLSHGRRFGYVTELWIRAVATRGGFSSVRHISRLVTGRREALRRGERRWRSRTRCASRTTSATTPTTTNACSWRAVARRSTPSASKSVSVRRAGKERHVAGQEGCDE